MTKVRSTCLQDPQSSYTKKTIDWDIIFHDEGELDFIPHNKDYNFFLQDEKYKNEPSEELVIPLTSPTARSGEEESSSEWSRNFRILRDIYEVTKSEWNLKLLRLFADYEPMNFQEAVEVKC